MPGKPISANRFAPLINSTTFYTVMKKSSLQKSVEAAECDFSRRHFLKMAGITALGIPFAGFADIKATGVSIIVDPADPIANSAPAQWATGELEAALKTQGIKIQRCTSITKAKAGNLCIPVAGATSAIAKPIIKSAGVTVPAATEALGLIPGKSTTRPTILATGHDATGLVYALLELADRVNYATSSPLSALHVSKAIVERPANRVRSLNRLFVSDIEDKPWFNDREMWPKYLTMLATQRFNIFNLSLGIGYDNLEKVTDGYFLFAYPFLLDIPGYEVHVPELPNAERDSNLRMIQFISEQTVARGMKFRLGIWMHGYEWLHSPNPNYTIKGLTRETHADYCRDAVRALLKACPAISGITFRVHGESGVKEGSYGFWKTIFEGVATCGRTVDIDMHAKGLDDDMMKMTLGVGLPVTISPKFWAEHMGMPYHQTDIRKEEIPKSNKRGSGLLNLSTGVRSFTRYGYSDLLKEDRKYDVVHRIWPGTQRLLLWGDPLTGAAQSRIFSFCGSAGVELMEPLSFKGRRGSGIPGDRCGYADATLKPRWDWEKYLYSLRVFGRTLYNPDTEPHVWRRFLHKQYGAAAEGTEQALAHATRILPTVLTAHDPSAGNNNYWPEMYTNISVMTPDPKTPYYDTPVPKVFGTVSPLDPQLFLTVNECAAELLSAERSGKYTPIEVAQWLSDDADAAERGLQQATLKSTAKTKPEFRRMAIDVTMQVNLGRFFANRFRSSVLYNIYEQTSDRTALEASLKYYQHARDNWAKAANLAKGIYKNDVTAGETTWLRGHWLDRLPAIEEDVAALAKKLDTVKPDTSPRSAKVIMAINECLGQPHRMAVACRHTQPKKFSPGNAIDLALTFSKAPSSVKMYYRHVNHAERFEVVDMKANGNHYTAAIPAEYTQSVYPLEYYFEVRENALTATIYPGFGSRRIDQPYYVIRQV